MTAVPSSTDPTAPPTFTGFVPPLDDDTFEPCLVLEGGIPDEGKGSAVVYQVNTGGNQTGLPHDPYVVTGGTDGKLHIDITDELPVGFYHLAFIVMDAAGNRSCVETEATEPNTNQNFLIVNPIEFPEPPTVPEPISAPAICPDSEDTD